MGWTYVRVENGEWIKSHCKYLYGPLRGHCFQNQARRCTFAVCELLLCHGHWVAFSGQECHERDPSRPVTKLPQWRQTAWSVWKLSRDACIQGKFFFCLNSERPTEAEEASLTSSDTSCLHTFIQKLKRFLARNLTYFMPRYALRPLSQVLGRCRPRYSADRSMWIPFLLLHTHSAPFASFRDKYITLFAEKN